MQDQLALAKPPLAFVALPEAQTRAGAHAARVLAIANIKGGVGKTTTAANLSAALAERGRRVLAVDLDPQASLTLSVGVAVQEGDATIGHALTATAAPLGSLQVATHERFDLIPASHDLRQAEHELDNGRVRVYALRDALEPLRSRYDYMVLDCPASAGILTGNALAAADQVIIPFPPDFLSLAATDWLISIIKEMQARVNPRLVIGGFLLSMYIPNLRESREMILQARQRYGMDIPFFTTGIPNNVRVREAPRSGQTVIRYAPKSPSAAAFRQLAIEVEQGIQERAPRDVNDAIRRARKELADGDIEAAYADFCRATEFSPQIAEGWTGRAHSASDPDEVIRCWGKALQLNPSLAQARSELAGRLTQRLVQSQPSDTAELMALAHYFVEIGRRQYAEIIFRRVAELAPGHQEAWLGLSRIADDPRQAVAFAQHALELGPQTPLARAALERAQETMVAVAAQDVAEAQTLLHSGERERAAELFRRAMDLDPRNAAGWLGMARTSDDSYQALDHVRRALEIDPSSEEANELHRYLWIPEKERFGLPITWQTVASIAVALLILTIALYVLSQEFAF